LAFDFLLSEGLQERGSAGVEECGLEGGMEGGVSVTTFPGGREGGREGGRGGTYLGGAGLDMCWGEGGGLQLVCFRVEGGREGGRKGGRVGVAGGA